MKTLLFPTDFSGTATHAIEYGYSIADQINANILLCNAVLSPSEPPQVGLCVCPMEETDALLKNSTNKLKQLAVFVRHKAKIGSLQPHITCITEAGTVFDIIQQILKNATIDLMVICTNETNVFDTFLLDDQARELINESTVPLLLVPPSATIGPVKKLL